MGYRAPLPFAGALGSPPVGTNGGLLSPLPFLGAFAGAAAGDQGGLLAPVPFMGAFAGAGGVVDQGGFRSLLASWIGGAGSVGVVPPSGDVTYKPVWRPRRRP